MSNSFALFRGTGALSCNSTVSNSSITTSTIDMNGGVITSGGTPINPNDVVNKAYVDSKAAGAPTIVVNLVSTTYTDILPIHSGSVFILVKNLVTNGPAATFFLSKNEAMNESNPTRLTSSNGINTLENLEVQWLPNNNIQLHKTGVNYDGQYQIKYIY